MTAPGVVPGDLRGTVSCLPGELATGGGAAASGPVVDDSPTQRGVGPATAWEGEAQNPNGTISAGGVYVLCVPAS